MKSPASYPAAESFVRKLVFPTFIGDDLVERCSRNTAITDTALAELPMRDIQDLCLHYQCGVGELTSYIVADKMSLSRMTLDEIRVSLRKIVED